MFSLNQAALLSLQLLMLSHEGRSQFDYGSILVSRGDSVMLTCNTSNKSATQLSWTKDRFYSVYSIQQNKSFSNFTSHRVRIDPDLPTALNISDVQHKDAGLYICEVTAADGIKITRWNLTVCEKAEGISPLWYFLYILPPATGLLLCVFLLAVCIYSCGSRRRLNQDPDQNQLHLHSGRQRRRDHSTYNSSHYNERINSIYNLS